jgi:hypothetical protein
MEQKAEDGGTAATASPMVQETAPETKNEQAEKKGMGSSPKELEPTKEGAINRGRRRPRKEAAKV